MWLYALKFVTCTVSADAFSLFYYQILIAKLSLYLVLNRIANLLAYVAALFGIIFSVVKLQWVR